MILFRCSRLGDIMTKPQSKDETALSETCKTYLNELVVYYKYGRVKDITNKFIEKGLMVEEAAITLYASVFSDFSAIKNEELFKNDYICGTPDLILDDKIVDIKSSWSIHTFMDAKNKINKKYYWQVLGYMWLTRKSDAEIAYCLINTPEQLIQDEMKRLAWKMGIQDDSDPAYIEAYRVALPEMVFDDIPMAERVHVVKHSFNHDDVELLKIKLGKCKQYIEERL